jgi:hypothetical protein
MALAAGAEAGVAGAAGAAGGRVGVATGATAVTGTITLRMRRAGGFGTATRGSG